MCSPSFSAHPTCLHHRRPRYNDSTSRGKTIGACVSTTNADFTEFYSQTRPHENPTELGSNLVHFVRKSLSKYFARNNTLPKKMILYRDGAGDGQIPYIRDQEVRMVKEACAEVVSRAGGSDEIKLEFIIVTKKVNMRLFKPEGNVVRNPNPGTLVDRDVTRVERFDFYMVPQYVNQGTVTPVCYNVICNDASLTADQHHRGTTAASLLGEMEAQKNLILTERDIIAIAREMELSEAKTNLLLLLARTTSQKKSGHYVRRPGNNSNVYTSHIWMPGTTVVDNFSTPLHRFIVCGDTQEVPQELIGRRIPHLVIAAETVAALNWMLPQVEQLNVRYLEVLLYGSRNNCTRKMMADKVNGHSSLRIEAPAQIAMQRLATIFHTGPEKRGARKSTNYVDEPSKTGPHFTRQEEEMEDGRGRQEPIQRPQAQQFDANGDLVVPYEYDAENFQLEFAPTDFGGLKIPKIVTSPSVFIPPTGLSPATSQLDLNSTVTTMDPALKTPTDALDSKRLRTDGYSTPIPTATSEETHKLMWEKMKCMQEMMEQTFGKFLPQLTNNATSVSTPTVPTKTHATALTSNEKTNGSSELACKCPLNCGLSVGQCLAVRNVNHAEIHLPPGAPLLTATPITTHQQAKGLPDQDKKEKEKKKIDQTSKRR